MRARSTSDTVRPTRARAVVAAASVATATGSCLACAPDRIEARAVGKPDRLGCNLFAVGEQNRTMDRVLQFPHVAAPRMRQKRQPFGFLQPSGRNGTPLASAYLRAKWRASAKMSLGRSRNAGSFRFTHIQPIEQVLAEDASLGGVGEVAIGRRDDADIDFDGLAAADAIDFAFLDGAQEFRLQPRIHFTDFVEQQCSAVGLFEFTNATGHRAREGAFLVTEEFGFEKVLRDGGAVDRDAERLVRAGASGGARSGRGSPFRCRTHR